MTPQQIVDVILHVTGKRYLRRDILDASGTRWPGTPNCGPNGSLPRTGEVFPRDSIKIIVNRLGYLPESFEPFLPN